jgi:N-acetylglucosamine kinase-like BadF-type ATPase
MLILGIDGGGSKTAVRIAVVESDGELRVLGEGHGGPSNVRAVGQAHAEINLNVAVDAAHRMAGTAKDTIDYAVLGLAGSSMPDVKSFIENWAQRRALAKKVDIVHDADPVLAVGAPDGNGIALIVGTGSSAIGRASDGSRRVTGGWGHWFGDTGSGYDLGRRALAAVADAVDGVGPETLLVERILERLHTDNPREILLQLGRGADVSREIASMAPILLAAAEDGDAVANTIVTAAAAGTAQLVRATIEKLGLAQNVPLAIAGGIVCSNTTYRETLLAMLRAQGINPASVTVVREPVEGCLLMARERLLALKSAT